MTAAPELTALDIASGYVLGEEPAAPPLPQTGPDLKVREAMAASVRAALERPPCLVSFSGGRDSSAILALAASVAREEGLPLPVAFTQRYPEAAETEESDWQQRVLEHLGLHEWVRQEFTDELDCVGPIATAALRRHGSFWPPNSHCLVPALEAAGAGSLVTGVGGDHLLIPGRHARLAAVLARRERPGVRDLARLLFAVAPAPVRAARRLREEGEEPPCPWLRPGGNTAVLGGLAREAAGEPVRRSEWAAWIWRLRAIQVGLTGMEALAADRGTQLVHPFLDPFVVVAFGHWARRRAPRDRTDAMNALFADLLPVDVRERRTKAGFDEPFWNRHARELALTLTPEEVDSELVDGARAVELWTADDVVAPFRATALFQSIWLERERGRLAADRGEQRITGGIEGAPVTRAP